MVHIQTCFLENGTRGMKNSSNQVVVFAEITEAAKRSCELEYRLVMAAYRCDNEGIAIPLAHPQASLSSDTRLVEAITQTSFNS